MSYSPVEVAVVTDAFTALDGDHCGFTAIVDRGAGTLRCYDLDTEFVLDLAPVFEGDTVVCWTAYAWDIDVFPGHDDLARFAHEADAVAAHNPPALTLTIAASQDGELRYRFSDLACFVSEWRSDLLFADIEAAHPGVTVHEAGGSDPFRAHGRVANGTWQLRYRNGHVSLEIESDTAPQAETIVGTYDRAGGSYLRPTELRLVLGALLDRR